MYMNCIIITKYSKATNITVYFLDKNRNNHFLRFTESGMVLSTDSEEVLSTLPQALDGVGHGPHGGTFHPLGLSLLQGIDKVTPDSTTTIIFWSCPGNCNAVLGYICNSKFHGWSWYLCNRQWNILFCTFCQN